MTMYPPDNLESQLRELPAPPVPVGLLARLLADVPARVENPCHVQRRHVPRLRLLVVGAAIAAGIAAGALVLPQIGAPRTGKLGVAPGVSPALILTVHENQDRVKETRICDILPPLPQS